MDLSKFARVPLAHLPTPLEPMDRLRGHLGGPKLWIKRDDCTGLGGGGNKTRKLEFLMADALEQKATRVVTFGALQSNHARQTCAAAARLGLRCDIILISEVDYKAQAYQSSGNLLLDRLFGAYVHIVPDRDTAMAVLAGLMEEAEKNGEVLYTIPIGGSSAIGALGYANLVPELLYQAAAQDVNATTILHASSSAGTQAGLVAGMKASGRDTRIIGMNVYKQDDEDLRESVYKLAKETADLIGGGQRCRKTPLSSAAV